MWIARDKDGSLWLFENKPIRKKYDWNDPISDFMKISDTTGLLLPELKWKDEPIEVNLVDVNKSIITDKDCIDEVYWREVRNNAAIAAMQSMIGTLKNISFTSIQEKAAKTAISCANILIKKLKSKELEKIVVNKLI